MAILAMTSHGQDARATSKLMGRFVRHSLGFDPEFPEVESRTQDYRQQAER